jgi:ubiquinone/menaquinone biosynthesis C-methylase UbiE
MATQPMLEPRVFSDEDVGQFDRWSVRYERSKWQWLLFDRVHQRAFDLAAPFGIPSAILDVGCGSGRLLRAAHRRWPDAHLVGVDPSSGMIEAGRRLTPAELHSGSAESLPVRGASIDVAFSTIAFHHWADPGQGLREVARVLRPGGHFVLIDNIGPDWLARRLRDRPYLTPGERLELWSRNGLRVLEQRKLRLFPIPVALLLATIATKPMHVRAR